MLKCFGVLLILISSIVFGNTLSVRVDEKIDLTEALVSLIMYMGASIKTLHTPISELFEQYNDANLERLKFLEVAAVNGIAEANKLLLGKVSDDVLQAIDYFADNLGGIDVCAQAELCSYTENRLREILAREKELLREKKRMYRVLPFFLGLSLIIILI